MRSQAIRLLQKLQRNLRLQRCLRPRLRLQLSLRRQQYRPNRLHQEYLRPNLLQTYLQPNPFCTQNSRSSPLLRSLPQRQIPQSEHPLRTTTCRGIRRECHRQSRVPALLNKIPLRRTSRDRGPTRRRSRSHHHPLHPNPSWIPKGRKHPFLLVLLRLSRCFRRRPLPTARLYLPSPCDLNRQARHLVPLCCPNLRLSQRLQSHRNHLNLSLSYLRCRRALDHRSLLILSRRKTMCRSVATPHRVNQRLLFLSGRKQATSTKNRRSLSIHPNRIRRSLLSRLYRRRQANRTQLTNRSRRRRRSNRLYPRSQIHPGPSSHHLPHLRQKAIRRLVPSTVWIPERTLTLTVT